MLISTATTVPRWMFARGSPPGSDTGGGSRRVGNASPADSPTSRVSISLVTVELNHDRIDRLREAFLAAGYDTDGVVRLLGPGAHAALGRAEPVPALRATADGGRLGTLIRLFLLGESEPRAAVEAALHPLSLPDAVAAEIIAEAPDGFRAGLDIRPHGAGEESWWVVSDLDSELRAEGVPPHREHVLGVGHASLSLVRATPRRPVDSVLDLGTGCGVQALHASTHARRVTGTDVSPRALRLAAATFRLNRVDVELLEGEWFTPVRGRRFDQVVCNPPFVVGPPRNEFVYRDSGLSGDDASALMVRQLPGLLTAGGTGHLLASWLHRADEDWRDRVAAWLPSEELDAWFVQRDIADPALYVGTWLRDAGYDPRSAVGRRKGDEWLDWFESNNVEGIGFGFVTLRRAAGRHGEVVCEDLRHAYDDPLGPEADQWLRRVEWLAEHGDDSSLLRSRLVTTSTTALEEVSQPGAEGWETTARQLHRTDGPGWEHEVDELGTRLLAGCQGGLPLEEIIALLALGYGEDSDELTRFALPVLRELIRHGMLLPAEWLEETV